MTGLGYTVPGRGCGVAVCALELAVLRTGLFRRPAYWLSMLIVLGFQIPVDGWLTKLSSPIVSLRRSTAERPAFPVRHPDRRFSVRLRVGHRGAAAVGAATCASVIAGPVRVACRRSTPARRPTTGWSAPARATTPHLRLSARRMRIPRPRPGAYGCSMPDAAPAPRRPRCSPSRPKPTSSPSTRRGECSTWRSPSAGPPRCASCTPPSNSSQSTASPARSTASWPPT